MTNELLKLEQVSKQYDADDSFAARITGRAGLVHAVTDVNLCISRGETLGLVGESGCGKSTLARLILRLEGVTKGKIVFNGTNITSIHEDRMAWFRRRVQIVFQDPRSSLNRSFRIETILASAIRLHSALKKRTEIRDRATELLRLVGLDDSFLDRFPHELSGGQRQRVGIARALAVNPELVILDEPVSALDVSIQAQIINLLESLQNNLGLTFIFISHDLNVVRYLSDRLAVMYFGRIVEIGVAEEIYKSPRHPYTKALLSAVAMPGMTHKNSEDILMIGEVPSPLSPPCGCAFHPRCPIAQNRCRVERPELREVNGVDVACHLAE